MTPVGCKVVFDVIRPFGGGVAYYAADTGILTPDFACGRGSGLSGVLVWTHYLDTNATFVIVDGVNRIPGSDSLSYSEGDEIDITHGAAYGSPDTRLSKYVVIWSEHIGDGLDRLYLMRDTY